MRHRARGVARRGAIHVGDGHRRRDRRVLFQIPNLDAGRYRLVVGLTGFAQETREVEVLARQTIRAELQLQVAGAAEFVNVDSSVRPVIETDRSTIDSSKSGTDISRLALNFRATNNTSPIVVATLAQGVQQDRGGQISIAGAMPFMASFSVDGISTQRIRYGGPSRELFPSVESMEEFRATTTARRSSRRFAATRSADRRAARSCAIARSCSARSRACGGRTNRR